MTKLLINEPPLQVLPSLAKLIGLSEAIVLQQLHYESRRSKDDGWVQRSIVEWHRRDFFFLSPATVERAFKRLRELDLIVTDVVAIPKAGQRTRETRMRVHMEALEAMEIPSARSRQIDGTRSRQSDGTSPINLMGPLLTKGRELTEGENPPPPAGGNGAVSTEDPDPVTLVFEAWRGSTGHLAAVLDPKRRRTIAKALDLFPAADVVDAVRGWRHSPHHRGENDRKTVYDGIHVLLRDAEQIEKFRDLEREHVAASGDARVTCPTIVDQQLFERWDSVIVPDLRGAVDESTFDIWLAELHPHRLDGDVLVLAAPPHVAPWAQERFQNILAGVTGRSVRVEACSRPSSTEGRAAA